MKILIFGATGMVGQGVLRECLLNPAVAQVLCVGRTPTGQSHPKLGEIVHCNLYDLASIEHELVGYDACLFCLGVSAAGMTEAAYRSITYDLTMHVAQTLARLNPQSRFLYVSGAGTNPNSRTMWARVKGQTEQALLKLQFESYMLRPGFIQPQHGVVSKTRLYRLLYRLIGPFYPVLQRFMPQYVTTTDQLAQAMLRVAQNGGPQPILENSMINQL
ncbi:NAD-dependent epimerase/dehydratase family protein [Herpetosiphon geysericola]|uniref:Epimerase n=1 Tax=Herpetosiphon geysericola TaxID=70996 RepID=A0A0P6YG24_9CHLR|nr:NAD(P)H-binding protein [Herpetosiphon geysericola]KPL81173.1 epimerase [Herpetosiphon geysericola]